MDVIYDTIKKIPGVTDSEAHEVATKLGSREDVATKSDIFELKAEIKAIKVELQMMKWGIGLVFVMNVAMFIKLFF